MRTTLFTILLFTNLFSFGQGKDQYESFAPSSKTLILSYDEFGPQVLAHEFIGFQWWQWNNHGDSDPKTKYDIRVIIFKDISLETVKNQYPINENSKIDFRYASYDASIKYLDNIIEENNEGFNTDKYADLRRKIISHFKSRE